MGRPAWFGQRRATDKERDLLAVPSNTAIRDLEEPPPEYGGHGRRPEETLVVVRSVDGGVLKHDYRLSHAPPDTPRAEFARVAQAAHRIEQGLKRSQSEAGLGEYQVRNWRGWHHHMALSLIATWFLGVEARRGKKAGSGVDGAAGADGLGGAAPPGESVRLAEPGGAGADASAGAERVGTRLPLQGTSATGTIEAKAGRAAQTGELYESGFSTEQGPLVWLAVAAVTHASSGPPGCNIPRRPEPTSGRWGPLRSRIDLTRFEEVSCLLLEVEDANRSALSQ
jgi:hypothetical protein